MEFRNIESQFVPVEISKYDVIRLLELSYEAFIPLFEHKNISYRLIKEVDDLEILIDAEKMEILFGNLLSNSFKQTREGGECYVKIHRDERYVVVDVFHSGPCLNDVQKTEIFQPYTSIDTVNDSPDGGIGLAIVNSIAKLMDIKMSVITYEGEGNIFRAEIPVITDDNVKLSVPKNRTDIVGRIIDNTMFTEEQLAIAGNAPGTRQTFQLLVVDSDGDTRKVLKRKLQEHFNVSTASTGKEALLLMKSQNMDAIISSLQLPEMDGYELCKIVKGSDRTRHIPFIMLSEDLSAESKIKGFRCGADLFVQKPVNIQEILLQLDNILRNKNFLRTYYANLNQLDLRKPEVNNADEIFIKELTEYIYAHLADNKLSVQELSRHTGISRTQLYMNIKRLTDHSPTSFVLNIKMAEAKKLLLTTDMTSSEISYKLGYCNSNHFSRQFKEYYNLSPGAFRKQQQN